MRITAVLLGLAGALGSVWACGGGHEPPRAWSQEELDELERKWGMEWGFTGIGSFAHLKYAKCLTTPSEPFDIGIIGVPFDTAVSYRPGARFGPRAIRHASSRQTSFRGFNPRAGINPYAEWATILDCGDMPITPMDNAVALEQMTQAFAELHTRPVSFSSGSGTGTAKPRLIALGGDHSLALPALRALRPYYTDPDHPLRVLHFDAHLDTWHPAKYPSAWPSEQANFNHGSMFWLAGREGLLTRNSSSSGTNKPNVHAGLRTRLSGADWADYDDDAAQNWVRIAADAVEPDLGGPRGVITSIMDALGTDDPVYLSVDIDVLDPAFAPGTGTPEPGGWTTRELIRVLRGIEGLNIVGADVVEVSPAYQGGGEGNALAAAQVVFEILSSMVKRGKVDGEVGAAAATAAGKGRVADEL